MKSLIRWATRNTPAMNTLMIATLVVGIVSMATMRREMFPEFTLDILLISVPYPGASPEEVEEGICQKLEEAVRSVEGIKQQTAIAQENAGYLLLELQSGTNTQKVLNEVRSEIDAIPSFPELAEEPDVKELTYRVPAIRVAVIGQESDDPEAAWRLRDVAERVRDDLLHLPAVSQADILGARNYQIDVEIPEEHLRRYGLTLQQVAARLARQNIELPGGTMRTPGQDVLLRGKNKFELGKEIARLPVLDDPSGDVISVAQLGDVRDGFEDSYYECQVDGRPGLVISVNRTTSEDLLAMAEQVRNYVANRKIQGYTLTYWDDRSVDVEDRMDMLVRNGLQGLVLVFLVLAIFLDLRLAFWVALGIPISVFGAGAVLLAAGQTLNMLSMFAFLLTLGIVVDDAIVVGENIYEHRTMDKNFLRAAIDGTYEVIPSVFASVMTTIIAFVPLMFVAGVMGKFFAVMPLAVIATLTISLVEATFILPCHLSHPESWVFRFFGIVLFPFRGLVDLFHWLSRQSNRLTHGFITAFYLPTLRWAIVRPGTTIALAVSMLLVVGGCINAGIIPFVVFPKLDTRTIDARVMFPDGTPGHVTAPAMAKLEEALAEVNRELGGGLIRHRYRMTGWTTPPNDASALGGSFEGGHLGLLSVELVPPEERDVHSEEILERWRSIWNAKYAAGFPGMESITFLSEEMGPGGTPIEFKLLASAGEEEVQDLEQAVAICKTRLADYDGVIDIEDDSRPGKWEYQIRVKEDAKAMGVTAADLAETVRAAYYGAEVMRLQRGRHEVKLMVRYPLDQRRSLAAFQDIRVRMLDGAERPITELADIEVSRGYSEINRRDQLRSITISAGVEGDANAFNIVQDLRKQFIPQLLEEYPGVSVRWEGQQEQTQESVDSLKFGLFVAILGMYALLTLEFRSYLQPLLILAMVPFGFIGAAIGHFLMGLEFTLLSLFGMIALTGVVVNDAIVLIDFINHRVEAGRPLYVALQEAGRRRFRPVILTSVTTVAGLTPMLLETSFQGQVLVPMATSLAFGLIVATAITLLLVPVLYLIYARATGNKSTYAESGLTDEVDPYIAETGLDTLPNSDMIPR
ncbi:MAG: efflux RND transporter permease subunit [Pirellulaceae bacterium]